MEAVKMTQAEMNFNIAERRVLEALTKTYQPQRIEIINWGGDASLFWSKKRMSDLFEVVHEQKRMITVQNQAKFIRKTFNTFQMKPSYKDFLQNVNFFKSYNNVTDSSINLTKII